MPSRTTHSSYENREEQTDMTTDTNTDAPATDAPKPNA